MTLHVPSVHCIFHTHPWSIDAIPKSKIGDLSHTLLIELSSQSQLACLVGKQHAPRLGIAGLLADPNSLNELALSVPRFPVPVVLAPNPPVSDAAQVSGVALLSSVRSAFDRFILFVHLADVEHFRYALPYCSRFSFLWDVADPPMYKMGDLGVMLRDFGVLNRESWGGFYWYNHPRRPIKNMGVRAAELKRMLGQMKKTPALNSTI